MDLRNRFKSVLRMCGHAFVSTVHIRLDTVEHQLNGINDQNNNIAATQTALLHAAIHSVEVQQQIQAKMQLEIDALKKLVAAGAAGVPAESKAPTDPKNGHRTDDVIA